MKDKIIIFLIFLNVLTLIASCGKLLEPVEATGGYVQVNLYGYDCITNNVSIWCN